MKNKGLFVFLSLVLLMSSFALAEEQSQLQTYSGFNRFIDDVKMFFSLGDNKVQLALEIRAKEVNSAILNTQNGDEEESDKNLDQAWEKLQLIQEKVSLNTAEQVQESSTNIIQTMNQYGNLSDNFEVYKLEEEKTGLTAEWVIETEGTENQTLSWEVVGNATGEQNRTIIIEKRIDEIDSQIGQWVVEHTYAEGTTAGGEGGIIIEGDLANTVRTEVANGDNGLKWEVKTSKNGEGIKNEEQNQYAEGTSSGGGSSVNSVDDTYDDDTIDDSGDCGDGVVCGGENDVIDEGGDNVIEGGEGSPGVQEEPSPAVDSNEGDDSSITGEVIGETQSNNNFFQNFFNKLFGA